MLKFVWCILSCILEEKIYFDENKDAAITFTPAISILLNTGNALKKSKKEKEVKTDLLSYLAPPTIQLSNQFSVDLKGLYELKPFLPNIETEPLNQSS